MDRATPDNAIALLQAMVKINTVNPALRDGSDGEGELIEYLERLAEIWSLPRRRLSVAGHADQLLITVEVESTLPWLLFDSHVDTVSVAGMTIDPFAGHVLDGKVWGRGACDTKGTGAAMLWALRNYAASNARAARPNNVALLFSVDEEVSMHGVESFLKHDLPALDWRPTGVIVGEPTELRPVVAHNGFARSTVKTRGKACHSSIPHEGRSAISDMMKVVRELEEVYAPSLTASHPLTGYATCSVNTIHGGSACNIIPDRCEIELDRRSVPGESIERDVVGGLDRALSRVVAANPGIELLHEVQVNHPPLSHDRNEALTTEIQGLLDQHGLPRLKLGAPFCSHAGLFDRAGLPAVVWGPGSPHPAHTKDEWVAVEQIKLGITVYEALMRTPLARPTR